MTEREPSDRRISSRARSSRAWRSAAIGVVLRKRRKANCSPRTGATGRAGDALHRNRLARVGANEFLGAADMAGRRGGALSIEFMRTIVGQAHQDRLHHEFLGRGGANRVLEHGIGARQLGKEELGQTTNTGACAASTVDGGLEVDVAQIAAIKQGRPVSAQESRRQPNVEPGASMAGMERGPRLGTKDRGAFPVQLDCLSISRLAEFTGAILQKRQAKEVQTWRFDGELGP